MKYVYNIRFSVQFITIANSNTIEMTGGHRQKSPYNRVFFMAPAKCVTNLANEEGRIVNMATSENKIINILLMSH